MISQQEALKQIQEISSIIESSNRFLMSGSLAIAYGMGISLIPVIEYYTNELTFGKDFGSNHLLIATVIHIIFYLSLFFTLRLIIEKIFKSDKIEPSHPLLAHALAFHRPVVATAAGMTLILGSMGLQRLVPALLLFLVGTLFNIYGRLSSKLVRAFSWSYILAGLVLGFFNQNEFSKIWYAFCVYLGLSFIVMGIHFRKEKLKEISV